MKVTFFLAVVLAATAVSAFKAPPVIPCTFSATLRMTLGESVWRFEYAISAPQRFKMDGDMQGWPRNTTIIYDGTRGAGGSRYTTIMPFFDRRTCAQQPFFAPSGVPCVAVPEDAVFNGTARCLHDSQRVCDVWASDAYVWYLLQGSSVPDSYLFSSAQGVKTTHFLAWNPTEPPESTWRIPDHQPCIDLGANSSSSSSNSDHIALLRAEDGLLDGGFVLAGAAAARQSRFVNDPKLIEETARKARSWKAGPNKRFDGLRFQDVRLNMRPGFVHVISASAQHQSAVSKRTLAAPKTLPDAFDALLKWPGCKIGTVRDQKDCGSCWAFGAATAFGDRLCIANGAKTPQLLSPQWLVSCDTGSKGCNGGFLDSASWFIRDTGVPSETCVPYIAETTACPARCEDGSALELHRSQDAFSVFVPFDFKSNVAAIKQELFSNGPLEIAFWVFNDFLQYKSGVYTHDPASGLAGQHAVTLVGWGHDDASGFDFWKIRNSWGENFGENGFFRIRMGVNECGIEDQTAVTKL